MVVGLFREVTMQSRKRPRCRDRQKDRVANLKLQARDLAGGNMVGWMSPEIPLGVEEAFLKQILACESAEMVPLFDRLVREGVSLPEPAQLSDAELPAKLWEVVGRLAALEVFLYHTDHMSDRELYSRLWHDSLRVLEPDLPEDLGVRTHIDFVSSGSDEDILAYLRYFADDQVRADWRADFPDMEIPEHEDPRFDRDRLLPKAEW
jgi:hypothetical protein